MEKGYCVKCNRTRPKGQWIAVELINPARTEKATTRGTKFMIKGKCPDCGSMVVKMTGKKNQEIQEGNSVIGQFPS